MKEMKYNTWNNAPCRSIFYHVTQGSHRAALYCFFNNSELFSQDLIKRILDFIYCYLRTDYDYLCSRSFYEELNNFYKCIMQCNDVDLRVSSFIYQSILKFYAKK